MKYVELKTGTKPMFVVEQEVAKTQPQVALPESLNHIIITDVSGSMSGNLRDLGEDLAKSIKTLPKGDTVSFGWFSGEGQYRFVVKGFKLSEDKDYATLTETIKKELYSRGMTCFSEILHDAKQVIQDLSTINPSFALTFLTDGYPVVSNYEKELKSIESAISQLQGKVASALLVGYGSYYNKELMASMAQQFGGSLVHSSNLESFSASMAAFLTDSREAGIKTPVKVEADISDSDKVFSINGKQVVVYQPTATCMVDFVQSKRAKDYIYVLTDKLPKNATKVELTDTNTNGKSNHEPIVKATYAAAMILTQSCKTDVAMEVLSNLGDVSLIKAVTNSYTHEEYGRSEDAIVKAMTQPSKRFAEGRNTNFLPPADAFCLLDVLNILMSDDNAYFHPQDDRFVYERISRATSNKSGYNKFNYNPDAKCPLTDLVWNDKKLNLSIKARIDGTVKLDGAASVGLQEDYKTYVYRNYSLVKDGFLNVQTLPVSLSEDSFSKLQQEGVIDLSETYALGKVVALDLTKVPVINRAIANGKTSAKDLCAKAWEEIKLEGQLKALRHIKSDLSMKTTSYGPLTPDQMKFLEDKGITKNGYSPLTERMEPTDVYTAKEFEIKIKGFSSLPSVNDVMKKCENKKFTGLTPVQELVAKGLTDFWNNGLTEPAVQLAWVNDQIKKLNNQLQTVRRQIQETKFAILLAKKWFDEFNSREENSLTVDGKVFTISVREVQVKI